MDNLSISQKYVVLALNNKGVISHTDSHKTACVLASALIDLTLNQVIEIEDKKIYVKKEIPNDLDYLVIFYQFLAKHDPTDFDKVVNSFSNVYLKDLIHSIGGSLVKNNSVELEMGGVLKKSVRFIPKTKTISLTINHLKAELLEKKTHV